MAEYDVSRRHFCRVSLLTTGALVLGVYEPTPAHGHPRDGPKVSRDPATPFAPVAFLRIDRDGHVTISVARPEIGTGVRTSLPMIVADELDADWSMVRVEQAPLDPSRYGDQYIGGSQSVRRSWDMLRHAGAVARAMLVTAAAKEWDVAEATCGTAAGHVIHQLTGRRLAYGRLTVAASQVPVPGEARLKSSSEFTIIGRPMRQVDARALATGRARFGIDTRIPGMLVAVIERSPILGGRIAALDDGATRAVPGVKAVIRIDADALPPFGPGSPHPANGVAVIADSTWTAMEGRRALRVSWEGGAVSESTEARRAECQRLAANAPERVVRQDGTIDGPWPSGSRTLDAVYEVPLLAHASMEPMNCVAHVHNDRCEVWVPTQNPARSRTVASLVLGVPPEAVTVNATRSGGGFGRRFYADFVAEAVLASRAINAPVQVVWTREDDIRHDFYRPASYHAMRGVIGPRGDLVAWSQFLVNAQAAEFLGRRDRSGAFPVGDEIGEFDFPAGCVPNLRLAATALHSPVPLGQWRAVDDSTNVFVYQSFIDELAHLAGQDPLAYRLAVLGPPRKLPYYDSTYDAGRLRHVLELAGERAGWGTPLPAGSGRGIAASYANHAYVAMVMEVDVTSDHQVRVRRVVTVADFGTIVNPLGAAAQVEGSVIYGLSAALKQAITVTGGRVEQSNFTDYKVVRMSDCPTIDVHLVPSTEPPLGAGEPALPPVAPALTNAIFAACGVRIRRLPVSANDLGVAHATPTPAGT